MIFILFGAILIGVLFTFLYSLSESSPPEKTRRRERRRRLAKPAEAGTEVFIPEIIFYDIDDEVNSEPDVMDTDCSYDDD